MTNEKFTEIAKIVFKQNKRITLNRKEFNDFLTECKMFINFPNIVILNVSITGDVTFRELSK